jgi:hypothetical protein
MRGREERDENLINSKNIGKTKRNQIVVKRQNPAIIGSEDLFNCEAVRDEPDTSGKIAKRSADTDQQPRACPSEELAM